MANENIKLYNDECLKIMKDIPSESIDLVCTDPPYKIVSGGCSSGIGKDGLIHQTFGGGGILSKQNPYLDEEQQILTKQGKLFKYNEIKFCEWLPEAYRVLKKNTHCYIMINARNLKELQEEAEKVGFIFQQLLVWDKGNGCPNKYYMNALEFILMLRKGKAKNINNMGTPNILRVKNVRGNKLHPTEKPIPLMKIMIENSTKENEIVLDLFMGAGATMVACRQLHRKGIGIEIDEKYFEIAKKRVGEKTLIEMCE